MTILHPRPSREQVTVNIESQTSPISVIVKGRPKVGRSTRKCCRGDERIRAGGRAEAFFSLATSYLSARTRGRWKSVEVAET